MRHVRTTSSNLHKAAEVAMKKGTPLHRSIPHLYTTTSTHISTCLQFQNPTQPYSCTTIKLLNLVESHSEDLSRLRLRTRLVISKAIANQNHGTLMLCQVLQHILQ